MIDLLVACIAFLLVSAVWAKTGAVEAQHRPPGPVEGPIVDPLPADQQLSVHISGRNVTIAQTVADTQFVSLRSDTTSLEQAFRDRRVASPNTSMLTLSADAATSFEDIVRVIDAANGVWNTRGGAPNLSVHLR